MEGFDRCGCNPIVHRKLVTQGRLTPISTHSVHWTGGVMGSHDTAAHNKGLQMYGCNQAEMQQITLIEYCWGISIIGPKTFFAIVLL